MQHLYTAAPAFITSSTSWPIVTRQNNMAWLSLTVNADAAYAESLSDALLELGELEKAVDAAVSCIPVYTGSFSDVGLMATAAKTFIANKADVLSGSAQAVVGAIGIAKSANLPWFGTQWTQVSLAPENVVSSQIYDWAPTLDQIFTEISAGKLGGEVYTLTLANGGLQIQFNPGFTLAAEVKVQADSFIKGISDGTIVVPQ